MGTGYEVDPEQIRSSGGGIQSSTQQLQADWQAFQGELAGFGEPWGSDDIGSLIGGCYQAVYEVAVEAYNDNLEDMAEHGEIVTMFADNHAKAEEHNVVEVNRVRDILG